MKDLSRIADAAASIAGLASDLGGEVRRAVEWMEHAALTLDSVRDQVSAVRAALEPMSDDLDALRAAFAGTNNELERLRDTFAPALAGIRTAADGLYEEVRRQREGIDALHAQVEKMGQLLGGELSALHVTIKPLVRDAGEVRDVVEPLQTATERVGRLAERLPGPGRKK
jgi:chromosome segregation ATPase